MVEKFSDRRWHDPPAYEVIGHVDVTPEQRLEGLEALFEAHAMDKETYEKLKAEIKALAKT